jgi:DNA helicase II / ATP-dependent DNA helicase PcrA
LMQDFSRSSSWLSMMKSSAVQDSKQTARIIRGEEQQFEKPKNLYTGKTYNSSDAISQFFKLKKTGESGVGNRASEEKPPIAKPPAFDRLKSSGSTQSSANKPPTNAKFVPGDYIRHEKYGKGLVLRREGNGDDAKLLISFPAFGQKKLIERFAKLEKA